MCYASALANNRRDAVEGEKLVITHHADSTNWLTPPGNPRKAVCLLDNTLVAVTTTTKKLAGIVSVEGVREEAIFRQKLDGVRGHGFFCFIESGRNVALDSFEARSKRNLTEVEVISIPKEKGAIDGRDEFENDETENPEVNSISTEVHMCGAD